MGDDVVDEVPDEDREVGWEVLLMPPIAAVPLALLYVWLGDVSFPLAYVSGLVLTGLPAVHALVTRGRHRNDDRDRP